MNSTRSAHKGVSYARMRTPERIAQLNEGKIISLGYGENATSYGEFVTRAWGNVQIDLNQVKLGDTLLIAPKELVVVGSTKNRLIANYGTLVVNSPEKCFSPEDDEMQHALTVCTECIHGSWTWDYLFRNTRLMGTHVGFSHGTFRAYDYFGCRCNACVVAHGNYLLGIV